jgi:hypothetical protein
MLKFQDEIAQKVVDAMRVQVSGPEQAVLAAPLTSSPEAYNLYLQARFYRNQYSMDSQVESSIVVKKRRKLRLSKILCSPCLCIAFTLYTMETAILA